METKSTFYPVGKLPQADLMEIIKHTTGKHDPRLILGPGLGRDAAVIEFDNHYLIAKSDPITFATDEIGWYAVNVNANDVACLGARPCWFMATVLLPENKTDKTLVENIAAQLHNACQHIGVTLVGGHTEITHGLDRPIIVGSMLGEVEKQDLVRSDGAQPGDKLILTKGISVEGTALLAKEIKTRLQVNVDAALLKRAADFLHNPGISVVQDATIATRAGKVHAMHDPTEGGIATGIHEITSSAGVGASITAEALPIYPETQALCAALDLDPLGLIASGSLLAAVAKEDAETIISALRGAGIPATIIGTIRETPGVVLRSGQKETPLPTFPRDEIAKLFEA